MERERESCLDEIIEEARGDIDKREKAYICPAIQRDPIIHISTKQQSKIICPAWLFFSGCSTTQDMLAAERHHHHIVAPEI